ncbi:MAG: PEP-CTERM sorting domain-containing protein [Verrucomicrobiaceae bacterium]
MKTRSLVLLMLLAPQAYAATVIDSFSAVEGGNPDNVSVVGVSGGTTVTFAISPTVTDPVGSNRRITVGQFSGGQNADLSIDGGGSAVLGSTAGATSTWSILYGINFPGLHFDATADGAAAFRLTFDSFDPDLEYNIAAYGYTGSGTSASGTYQPITSSVVDVLFSSFSNFSNIGFNDLNQLEIRIRDSGLTHGGTASITQFETIAVPEPSRAALLVAALTGWLMRRRRRVVL